MSAISGKVEFKDFPQDSAVDCIPNFLLIFTHATRMYPVCP